MYRKAPSQLINVAAVLKTTQFLGPGNRAVLWVRGCYANCPGCIAPDWQSPMPENYRTVTSLVDQLVLHNPGIAGISISGGEPFLQAEAIANFLTLAKENNELNSIVYSGYTIEKLSSGNLPGAGRLLSLCDVLIDGRYEEQLNQDHGLYGSSNQRVHCLTDTLRGFNFDQEERKVELRYERGEVFLVGVPGKNLAEAFFSAVAGTRAMVDDNLIPAPREVIHECE